MKPFIEYADARTLVKPIDVHAMRRHSKRETAAEFTGNQLDFANWLPFAAEKYHISKNPDDYILVPVLSIPSDLPNRNGVAFPLSELLDWSVDDGMQAYRTFNGKPVFVEHQNSDPTTAIGVIVDTSLKPIQGFGRNRLWKLVKLLAIDRDKGYEHAEGLLNGTDNTFSMGAYVSDYSCSYCGAQMGQCQHISRKNVKDFYVLNGRLVFRRVHGIKGFECSKVASPAYLPAASQTVMRFNPTM